jgi:GNAT superfamily N-acetyltransferase
MTFIIRPAEPGDADAVFGLASALATSFAPQRAAFNTSFASLLSDDSAHLLVVAIDGQVVGYCLGFDHFTFYANGRVSWVEEVMVQPDLRGQGIGHALMDAFEDWAKSRDSKLVALATRRAAPFYLALGYEESATYFRKLL